MTTLISLPDNLKGLEGPIRALIAQAGEKMAEFEASCRSVDYGAVERSVGEGVAEIERAVHTGLLEALVIDAPQVKIKGEIYRRVVTSRGTFNTLAGPVSIVRPLFRRGRNERTLDPVALRAGAINGAWLPATAGAMAYLLQQGTSREAESTGCQLGRARYSRSAYEDVGHAVATSYQDDKIDIDDAWILQFDIPKGAASLSASLDRVSVPVIVERTLSPDEQTKDAPKRPIEVVYRMAYCATLTLHGRDGHALHTLRYGAAPGTDASAILERALADTIALLLTRPRLRVVLIADGAPEMWNLLRSVFNQELLGRRQIFEVLDFYHLIEKLGAAARVLSPSGTSPIAEWKLSLLNRAGAASSILRQLVSSGLRNTRVGDQRPVHDAITYLENHAELLDYVAVRNRGLPIGSGIVEAACKSLFNHRLKRSGARWSEAGAGEIVDLRAMALSGRWAFGLRALFRRRRTNVDYAA